MDVRWAKEYGGDKAQDAVRAAKHVLDTAIRILEKDRTALLRPKPEDYDCPSWSHKQAHVNGELAMLNKVIDLLTIKDKSNE